jgi:hypothetical protein
MGLVCAQRESRIKKRNVCGAINEVGNAWDGARNAQVKLWLRYVAGTNRVLRPDRRCVYAIVKSTAEAVVFCQPVRIWQFVVASVGVCRKEGRAPSVGIRKWHICTSQIAPASIAWRANHCITRIFGGQKPQRQGILFKMLKSEHHLIAMLSVVQE